MTIQLIAIDRALPSTASELERELRCEIGDLADLVAEVIRSVLSMPAAPAPWGGYLTIDPDSRRLVGTCAFKSAPDEKGDVEIAYFTFPPFEGQGYASRMAAELGRIAAASPQARRLVAHTLPETNASTSVLSRLGFACVGEVIDPEDGPVWRWELRLSAERPPSFQDLPQLEAE